MEYVALCVLTLKIMAQRRMFSKDITENDAFLDMPLSSQALYFHLGMAADDDGFVSPNRIVRMIGCQGDDLKLLIAKKFVLPFEDGVVVIKHWKINNYIQADRYKKTTHQEKMALLKVKENGGYTLDTECIQNVRAGKVRIGKERKGKERKELTTTEHSSGEIVEVIDEFRKWNKAASKWYGRQPYRQSISRLLVEYGKETVLKVVAALPQSNKQRYFPTITTPIALEDKWQQLEAAYHRLQDKKTDYTIIG